jgi:hypothetical protein
VNSARVFSPRRRRGIVLIAIIGVLLLIVVVAIHRTSLTSSAPTCLSARVRLLAVTSIPGGLGHAGVVVRSSVSSYERCAISGYPAVDAGLSSRSSAKAIDVRDAYLGGVATRASASLPRLIITSHPRIASFTIQWADGNGPTCPTVVAIHYSLPDLKGIQTARSMYDGIGVTRFMGIYCHYLSVTPLVQGSTGSAR